MSFSSSEAIFFGVLGYIDLFLQGVLCAQLAHYISNVDVRESAMIKLFVVGLALLTTLKSVQVLAVAWIWHTTLLADDLDALSEFLWTNWLPGLTLILQAVITFYVQTFFCYRLWVLSHNIYIVAIAMTIFVVALAAAAVATHFFGSVQKVSFIWYTMHVGVTAGGDIIQTGGIVFYLLRHSKNALRRGPTASMLNSLLRVTIQSAAPATFCALLNFITNVSDPGGSGITVQATVSGITGVFLPKCYAVAAMWTLNSREGIRVRSAAVNEFLTDFELRTTAGGTSNLVRTGMARSQSIGWQPHDSGAFKPSPETSVLEVISVQ
ncbi:hypothetical protein C8R45DRAFT_1026822 [Mycena sanguinolenta]|nr:hypothetical protein C8R45DRAFT_1026822 [Mycena sanguinolenta]